ncbi:MAG: peptidase propeptide domain-containing protein [Clostridium butyricum]|nr:peptidase propeptide domain-containing protein [Clostridium butyricum]
MRTKNVNFKIIVMLIVLLAMSGIAAYKFWGPGAEDISKSRKFIEKLYSINAISTDIALSDIKYEKVKSGNNKTELTYSTVVTQNYGIDLDKEKDVIGFAKKDTQPNITKIEIEEAQSIAEKYVNNIYEGDICLKSIKNEQNLPYYSFVFAKQKYGYLFYFDEIKVNINKESGFMDGYSNMAIRTLGKEPQISISEDDAKKKALETFESYNGEGKISENIQLVYCNNKIEKASDNIEEVCYMVVVDGDDSDGNKVSWRIFINANDAAVFNILKNGLEKEVKTS